MPHYRIHTTLSGFTGAKTGKTYHATPESIIEAPEGEFKALKKGGYSLYQAPGAAKVDPVPDAETNE